MLTDKAKQMFEEWYYKKYRSSRITMGFNKFPLSCQQALIVEWLDGIEIYLSPIFDLDEFQVYFDIGKDKGSEDFLQRSFKTRPEALAKAIEKVNQIINLKE